MKIPKENSFRNILTTYGFISVVVFLFQTGGMNHGLWSHMIYLGSIYIGLFAIFSTVKIFGRDNPQQKAFKAIFVGGIFAAAGQTGADIYSLLYKSQFLYSISTLLFFLGYLAVLGGYIRESLALKVRWKDNPSTVYGFIIFALVIVTTIYKFGTSGGTNLLNIGYTVGDVLLIVTSLIILQITITYKGGLMARSWLAIFVGHFTIVLGDVVLAVFNKPFAENIWPYTLIRLIWLLANLVIAYGFYSISGNIRLAQRKIMEHKKKS